MNNYLKDPGATYIDVRSSWEFEAGHIDHAINIPLELLSEKWQDIQQMKTPDIFYCRSGNRIGMALTLAKNAGIAEVYNGGSFFELSNQMMSHV